ncbi:MAG: hypothetical protein ILA34_06670 [Bacteroidaceae bacterium]|nr:hypothetical protein [Bacteroidaceae bacterium]
MAENKWTAHGAVLILAWVLCGCVDAAARPVADGRQAGQEAVQGLTVPDVRRDSTFPEFSIATCLNRTVGKSQGMDIHRDRVFCIQDGGTALVFDLKARTGEPLATFPLGSKRAGNHSNTANFGVETAAGASFPLLYVSIGKAGDEQEFECNVESVTEKDGQFSSECVQVIRMDQSQYQARGLQPIWGCPNWLVDKERRHLWAFSAIKRTLVAATGDMATNKYVATKFRIPALSEGRLVVLTAADVLDQVVFDFDTYITQGGCMKDGRIYYAYGFGKNGTRTPSRIRAYDTDTRSIVTRLELEDYVTEELEDLSVYGDKLYVNTNSAYLYEVDGKFVVGGKGSGKAR